MFFWCANHSYTSLTLTRGAAYQTLPIVSACEGGFNSNSKILHCNVWLLPLSLPLSLSLPLPLPTSNNFIFRQADFPGPPDKNTDPKKYNISAFFSSFLFRKPFLPKIKFLIFLALWLWWITDMAICLLYIRWSLLIN